MFMAGWCSTTLVLPPLADKIGRKWITIGSMGVTIALMIGMLFSKSLDLTISMMFFAGMATSGRELVGYVYGNEFFTPRWQVFYGTMFIFMDGISIVTSAMYYDWISKQYIWFALIGIILAVINISSLLVFVPESPLWQLKSGKQEEAQVSIHKLMVFNGMDEDAINQELSTFQHDITLIGI